MKLMMIFLVIFSVNSFGGESEGCWGEPYWELMEKSQRICNYQEQILGNKYTLSCNLKYHNDPNVCYSYCIDGNRNLVAKLRVDMISDCSAGVVEFKKTKTTWYR